VLLIEKGSLLKKNQPILNRWRSLKANAVPANPFLNRCLRFGTFARFTARQPVVRPVMTGAQAGSTQWREIAIPLRDERAKAMLLKHCCEANTPRFIAIALTSKTTVSAHAR
jgi:hypothetical protein